MEEGDGLVELVFVAGLQEVSKLTVPMSFGFRPPIVMLVLRKRRLHEPETQATDRHDSLHEILRGKFSMTATVLRSF